MSEYYTSPTPIPAGTRALSNDINNFMTAVTAGFDALPADLDGLVSDVAAIEAQVIDELGLPVLEDGKYLSNNGALLNWGSPKDNFEQSPYIGTVSNRTSNTILAAADRGKLISCTNTFTQTFTAAATLGASWFCYIKNAGTGDITLDPNGSETIDGLASYVMYPGEVRFVQCNGTAFYTVLKEGFLRVFTTSETFYKPPGYAHFVVDVIAGGSGGSGGRGGSAGSIREGGNGGGGGARRIKLLKADNVGDTETVTVGAGSAGGTGGSATFGAASLAGGSSSFGNYSIVYGGGPANVSSSPCGAGGGGGISVGTGANGGRPISTYFGTSAANTRNNISEGGAAGITVDNGACSEYGGSAGGSGPATNVGYGGGASIFGGSGGGGAGSVNSGNTHYEGGGGGVSGTYTPANPGGGGVVAGGNGPAGANGDYIKSGSGGGGGGGNSAGTGGVGGAGGVPGGGGGGGGGGTTVGGAGGAGGRGEVRIWGVR